ncbi:MAG: UDP-N-acetylglucosamine 2-epimerase (non-hydrolyzing) [Methanomassiliicoccales archaeon]|nr:MAG: UDP-N-acetylglucosamine 2-epimerase (non-hydrolyzing) [Methanomassiliicoccales archaeon]
MDRKWLQCEETRKRIVMRICIVVGTRPEIIKMSPIIRECENRGIDYFMIHTNQHYSYTMDRIFFEELQLPEPKYNLEIGSGTHGVQTGKMLMALEKTYTKEKPSLVLVEGDTNTVLAAALAASKCHIDVGHVEAGLRSFDKTMPEEINRLLTDHLSSNLFAPTEVSKKNLTNEGISEDKIYVVGNTIVDATLYNLKIAKTRSKILDQLNLAENYYFLLTLHRQENVDDKKRLESIITSLEEIESKFDIPLIYPIHPRADKMMKEFGLKSRLEGIPGIKLIEPVGYLDFLVLEKGAKLVLTDSGGVQEEACILNVPCVTLRYSTERPETVSVGKNVVVGVEKDDVLKGVIGILDKELSPENPFGDGKTGQKIVDILV